MKRISLEILVVDEVATVEELILYKNDLKALMVGYEDIGLDTPEWITDKMNEVEAEITVRVKVDLQKSLKQAKARRAALMTADEKRTKLDAEIAALEKRIQ